MQCYDNDEAQTKEVISNGFLHSGDLGYLDDEGHLINVAKIRGKSNVVPALVKHLERDAENLKDSVVMVAHADNLEGAEQLKKAIKGKCKEVVMTDIGPVIGTHVGSGMLAVLFLGTRNLKS